MAVGLVAYAAVVPDATVQRLLRSLLGSDLAPVVLAAPGVGAAFALVQTLRRSAHSAESVALLAALTALFLASAFTTAETTSKLNAAYLCLGGLGALVAHRFRVAGWLLPVSGGLYAAVSLAYQMLGSATVQIHGLSRQGGLAQNVSLSYVFLVVSFAAVVGALVSPRPLSDRTRWGLRACAALILFGVVATYSRNSGIAIAAVLIAAYLGYKPQRRTLGALMALGLVAVAVIVGARGQHKGVAAENQYAATGRLAVWSATLSVIRENPLTGVGLGQFRAQVVEESPFWTNDPKSPFLLLTAEAGVFGILLSIGLIAVQVRIVGHPQSPPWLRLATLALLSLSIFDSPYFALTRESGSGLLAFLLMCAALPRADEEDNKDRQPSSDP